MRIYITGVGAVTGIGMSVAETIHAMRKGETAMGKPTLFQTAIDAPVCEVKRTNGELREFLGVSSSVPYSRTALLGMIAAKEAYEQASPPSHLRIGLISSTSNGGMDLSEQCYPLYRAGKDVSVKSMVAHDCGDSTERIASYLGIKEFSTTISTACSSAGNAIQLGARMIRLGLLDAVIAGGTDALCRFTMNGFNSLMILDKVHCRPFDHTREGLNLGEGAGYVVLQGEHTLTTQPLCRLAGYSNSNDAYHQTATSPDGEGPYRSMSKSMAMAGIEADKIDYINVHGTGTLNNDLSEGKAIARIFGSRIPPFSSIKPFLGHTLGASEGIEAALSVIALNKGFLFPNLNFTTPMDELPLSPVITWTEGCNIRYLLSNSFGFGGNNSSLLFAQND